MHALLADIVAAVPPPTPLTDKRINRIKHRLSGVAAVQNSIDHLIVTMFLPGSALPPGPNPYDPTISKRSWEIAMGQWRKNLRILRSEVETDTQQAFEMDDAA